MPRPPRAFAQGIYHFAAHGSDSRHLFLTDEDRKCFLDRLSIVAERFELRLIAYTLLGNHYHLVAWIPDSRISTALQQLHGWYSNRLNRLRGRRAHLFRAHFFAREVESDSDLLGTCAYLAFNPIEAGLAGDPFTWPWSSSAASAGLADALVPLDEGPLRASLGGKADWQRRYRAFMGDHSSVT
jgi:putative transposase